MKLRTVWNYPTRETRFKQTAPGNNEAKKRTY